MSTKVFAGLVRGQAQRLGLGYWSQARQAQVDPEEEAERRREATLLTQAQQNLRDESSMAPQRLQHRYATEAAMIQALRQDLFEKSRMMSDMYARMDPDGSKMVDYREFQHGLRRAGMQVSDEEAMTLLLRYDRDGDGRLELNEFMRILQNAADIAVHDTGVRSVGELGGGRTKKVWGPAGVQPSHGAPSTQLAGRGRPGPPPVDLPPLEQRNTQMEAAMDRDLRQMAGGSAAGLTVGSYVRTDKGLCGTVRYAGSVAFSRGMWAGLELDSPDGKNDGSVQGHQYFSCAPNHGLFVRALTITPV